MDGTEGQYTTVQRGYISGQDGVEPCDDCPCRQYGIMSQLGLCAVGTFSVNMHIHFTVSCHHGAFAASHFSLRYLREDMTADDTANRMFFKKSRIYQKLCATGAFFRRLEDEDNIVFQFIFMFLQVFGKAQQHCHMAVMTAGMHTAHMLGSEVAPCLFCDRQGIHIRTERHRFFLAFAANHCHDACFQPCFQLCDTEARKFFPNIGGGFVFLQAQFGDFMQIAAHLPQFFYHVLKIRFHWLSSFVLIVLIVSQTSFFGKDTNSVENLPIFVYNKRQIQKSKDKGEIYPWIMI